jgi:hypothetical protein
MPENSHLRVFRFFDFRPSRIFLLESFPLLG